LAACGVTNGRGDVRLGILAPVNGPDAAYGVALTNGVDMALSYHEQLSTERFRVRVEDTSDGEGSTIQRALHLLDRGGSQVLLGEIWSVRTLAIAGVTLARGAILISPVAPHPDIATLGEGIYSLAVPRRRQLGGLLRYARDSLGVRRPAIFYADDGESAGLRERAQEVWTDLGMPRPVVISYRRGQHDFVKEVQDALDGGMDAFLALGSSRETLSLVSHASQGGFLGPYLGLETLGTQENLHLLKERSCIAAFADDSYLVTLPGQMRPELFDQSYRQRYGTSADAFARHGYLSLLMLSRALDAAEGDVGGLLNELEELRDPLLPDHVRVLRPPDYLARVRLVLVQGGKERDVW
jgi:branched-chain amino acid transport system substrate-binding protein